MSTIVWLKLLLDIIVVAYCFYFIRAIVLLNRRAPFVPTRDAVVQEIAERIGRLPANAIFYDLGCGDARMLREMVRLNPHAKFVGIELQLFPYLLARIRTAGTGIRIMRGNIFTTDLTSATHVYAYLYDNVLDALLPKLRHELRPDTMLYALDFKFADFPPVETTPLTSRRTNRLGEVLRTYCF